MDVGTGHTQLFSLFPPCIVFLFGGSALCSRVGGNVMMLWEVRYVHMHARISISNQPVQQNRRL